MRSIFISWLAVISPLFCLSQGMFPRVTNMAGFDMAMDNIVVTVSIGEPAVTTLTTTTNYVTQGFLQPEIFPCPELSISYYPNPAKDEITIEAFGCDVQIQSLQIIDLWGRLITTAKPTKDNKLNLTGLSQGVYVIRVLLSNDLTNNINIVKLAN
jgi:Secretion system C-terminal sorting domain